MSGAVILVADDDRSIRTVLTQALGRLGYDVRATANAATLWGWIAAGEGDLVITDVIMPDENGLDLLPRIKRQRPELPVIVMSARNTLRTAVTAAERGAYEYLPKPFDLNELVAAAQSALAQPLAREASPSPPSPPDEQMPLIGSAPAMQDIYRAIARLTGTDLTVMITGESGTGKELVARALHEFGRRRRHGPFVAINMAAIPRELIESEMFGHEKGAFTGANARHVGRFEQAEGGTLFLDEIGDMPLDAQTRLLRVLQSGEYTRVGGTTAYKADVRIIAATHRELRQLVRQGQFREDLFYRLNVVPLRLPPLRERIEDLPELAQHFLAQAAAEGLPQKALDGQAIEVLKQYSWPGNVRELENLMRRLAALTPDDVIAAAAVRREIADASAPGARAAFEQGEGIGAAVEQHLDTYFAAHRGALPPNGLYLRLLHEVERPLIALSLRATRGNQLRAAELLGINRNTLRKKIRELDIPVVRGTR